MATRKPQPPHYHFQVNSEQGWNQFVDWLAADMQATRKLPLGDARRASATLVDINIKGAPSAMGGGRP